MTLNELLAQGRIQRHRASANEVAHLLGLAERGAADAGVDAISTDLRFCAAYDAALPLATIPLACAGYRTRGAGHHATTLAALPIAMGSEVQDAAGFLEVCRTKRNVAQYQRVGSTSGNEVQELLCAVTALRRQVLAWLDEHYPHFLEGSRCDPQGSADAGG